MQEKDLYCPYISVVAAVSQDKGLEYLETHMGAINSELFVDFVKRIVNQRKQSKVALFMDNAKFHVSKYTKEALADLPVKVILNVAYCPQYNPIEGCFSVVKRNFKSTRLNELVNRRTINYQKEISNAFHQLTTASIQNYITSSMRQLKVSKFV